MFAHIRQPVRQQPDTGYRKRLLPYFAAVTLGGGWSFVEEWVGYMRWMNSSMVRTWRERRNQRSSWGRLV
jgi:hypothetical protein